MNLNELIYTTIFLIVSILIANKISNLKKTQKKINISYQRKIIQGNDSKLYKIILDLYNKKAKNDTIDQYFFFAYMLFLTQKQDNIMFNQRSNIKCCFVMLHNHTAVRFLLSND